MTNRSRGRANLALVLLALLAGQSVPAAFAQTATPTAPAVYMGRRIATTMHYTGAPWLVRESRQREEDCESLLRALAVKTGQTVCDLGCGNGFYTLKLARQVGPKGRVYAVDIQPEMLRMLKEAARRERLRNVVPQKSLRWVRIWLL